MIRKISVAIVIVLVVIGGLVGVKGLQFHKLIASAKAGGGAPAETISAAEVRQENWQNTLSAIGSITADQGVMVNTEIAGIVREIAFESGALVAKGDLLVRLDTSSEEAQLRALEAEEDLARLNLERQRKLRTENMVSQADLDAAEATMKQNQGNADAVRATIAKKTIRAPFGGRLGIRMVNLGQYLDVGKPVVSLQSLTPVHADFSLPQQELARLKAGMKVKLYTDAYPERVFEGVLSAINPDLDASTRSVGLRATFENADQSLRPGMFARAEVLLPEQQNVLVIPVTALLSAPYGDSVYVIEPGQNGETVRQQFIRVGQARGDFITVETGLKPGQRVVSTAPFKLRNGMTVVENNQVTPKPAVAPTPPEG